MKAAFFYSQIMEGRIDFHRDFTSIAEINGKRFTEYVSLDDDAEVKPYSKWEDSRLVALVENVDVFEYYDRFKTCSYSSGPLKGRIKINGKIQ
jgi:hypothetical protein